MDDALPAALALRLRMAATGDWAGLAAEAAAAPDRWRLPLQYLWGLWPGGHAAFFAALLSAGQSGAALAAQSAAVNLAPDELVEFVAQQGLSLPGAQWLAFSTALDELGEHASARAILRPHVEVLAASAAKEGPPSWNPLELNLTVELERSLLAAATDDYALAHPVLAAAWTQLRQLRAVVAGHIGRLALQADDLVTAQAGYLDAYSERPEDPAYRTGLADVLTKLGRPEEALALLAGHNHAAVHLSATRAHLALGQLEQAREALAAVVAAENVLPPTLAAAARLQAQIGDVGPAAHTMQRAAQGARTDSDMFLQAAQWLLERNQPEEAFRMATEAAALAPSSATVRETMGRSLLACGRPADAIPHFQAAALEPLRHSALIGLAQAALAANVPEQTVAAADTVLTQQASSPSKAPAQVQIAGEAHTLAGQALSLLGREDDAFEHFGRATTLVPAAPEPWRAIARHHLRQGDPAQALATLEAGRQALAVVQSSESAPLLGDLAECYVAAGRPTEAILALREACKADPSAQAEHQRLGKLLRRQGSVAEAVDVLRHALELKPGDGPTLYELAQALEHVGQLDEAWSALQQTALTRPAEADPYIDLGRLTLVQLRKANSTASPLQAIAALRAGIDRDGQRAEAHGLLAQAQQLAGDAHGALASYQRALHLAPMRTD
ncbi:MAG: tetratricopeptide repeat protein, partial [Anaerolineales bacterium]